MITAVACERRRGGSGIADMSRATSMSILTSQTAIPAHRLSNDRQVDVGRDRADTFYPQSPTRERARLQTHRPLFGPGEPAQARPWPWIANVHHRQKAGQNDSSGRCDCHGLAEFSRCIGAIGPLCARAQ